MCVHIYMLYICMYIHIFTYIHIFVCIHTYVYMCMNLLFLNMPFGMSMHILPELFPHCLPPHLSAATNYDGERLRQSCRCHGVIWMREVVRWVMNTCDAEQSECIACSVL